MHAVADMKELLADCPGLNGRVLTACMWKKSAVFKLLFYSKCLCWETSPKPHMNFQQGCLTHFRDALDIKWGLSHFITATISMHEYTYHN